MKVAVFHNYLDVLGGAERVGLTLARELGADVYSTNIDPGLIRQMGFEGLNIRSIGAVPKNAPQRQQMTSLRFRFFKPGEDYDFNIIDGDWAVSAAVRNKPNMWYAHSPIRDIWDLYDYVRSQKPTVISRLMFDAWALLNRRMNLSHVRHAGKVLSNSQNTRVRLKKYLGRDSTVVYPPIETKSFRFGSFGGYWLSVNRLADHKRIDMQMNAFRKMPDERLIIVGGHEESAHSSRYAQYVRGIKPDNVQILGSIPFERLVGLYSECKGFITTSLDEDFGMAPVEAMASGKPVIAPNEGGYRETVLDGATGRLIDGLNEDKLITAVKDVGGRLESFRTESVRRAGEFDTSVFIRRMREEMGA